MVRNITKRDSVLAKEVVTFPTLFDDDACRFVKDDVVDDENDDRRLPFYVDIFQFFFSKESSFFSCVLPFPFLKDQVAPFHDFNHTVETIGVPGSVLRSCHG